MHNWGAGKARLMSGLSARLQLLDLACHTHSNQPCKNYRLHWFLVFICKCLWGRALGAVCEHTIMCVPSKECVCVMCAAMLRHACAARTGAKSGVHTSGSAKSASGSLSVCWLGLWEAAREHTEPIIIRYGRPTVIISNTHSALCSNLKSIFGFKRIPLHAHVHVRVATQSLNVHAWKVQCAEWLSSYGSIGEYGVNICTSVEIKNSLRMTKTYFLHVCCHNILNIDLIPRNV